MSSIPATKRIEIWLHTIKGELEYEQSAFFQHALEQPGVPQQSPVEWGPRMRAELEKDPDTILDWLCEIGAVRANHVGRSVLYERDPEWKPAS